MKGIFKVGIFIFLFLLGCLYTQEVTFAHPGRTDEDGGHYCHTNCEDWGLEYEEYHYHDSTKEESHNVPTWVQVVGGCSVPVGVYFLFKWLNKWADKQ
jgi:hypothetical protein